MKELVILDLDGVIIRGQSQKHLLDYLKNKKIISLFFYLKIYFLFILYKLKIITNPSKIIKYSYVVLKNKDIRYVENIISDFFNNYLKCFIYSDMIDIIKEHRNNREELVILSSSADFIVKSIANYFGIKHYIATKFEIINGFFTGNIDGDIIYGMNKVYAIKKFVNENNLNLKNSLAYADHISDYYLLKSVNHPVAVNPDKFLFKKAIQKNWEIIRFNK